MPPIPLAHYLYTAEAAYEEIALSGDELFYTHVGHLPDKCASWVGQAPCWSYEDLVQHRASLSARQVQAIRAAIVSTGFFSLAGTLGGAKPEQRYYPVLLAGRDSAGSLKEVTYQSFPGATPMPDAFVATFEVLASAVCKHLGKEVHGPFPPSTTSCP